MHAATFLVAVGVLAAAVAAAQPAPRAVPRPTSTHPGNVFLRGEEAVVPLPGTGTGAWRLTDYEGRPLATAPGDASTARLGRLPVGFYRLSRDGSDWVSLAVLEPLAAPTPRTSPICLDVAMAWFYKEDQMKQVADLCALAGVNRVRDRLTWGDMEPERGRFVSQNRYDVSAADQSGAGLSVLQVNHSSPAWANPKWKRFPLDLRDAYGFYREMARRWRGKVAAFEPWNEADIEGFGGHTGAEMAAMQKASYLGLKAGNPDVIGCLNVFATHVRAQLDDLAENEAWPYFDTYNLHHYEGFAAYPRLYADHRSVSAGRPMWTTECAMPVRWSDPKTQEPSEQDLREQAERIAKVYAGSIHEGTAATFYFILGHYVEGQTQFGIIRKDLTPRPAYVALAAAGRLLADARPLGRVASADPNVRAYAFRASPGGVSRVVIVAWADRAPATMDVRATPVAAYDHLGRPLAAQAAVSLGTAPVFVVLPAGKPVGLTLEPAPPAPARLPGKPSPIVVQALWPEETKVLSFSAHRIAASGPTAVKVAIYNFGARTASGTLQAVAPEGWHVRLPASVKVAPGERVELTMEIDPAGEATRLVDRIQVRGDFGAAGKPVLAFRVMTQGNKLAGKAGAPLAGATDAASWRPTISGDGPIRIEPIENGVLVDAQPGGGDRWIYPVLTLPAQAPVPPGAVGLACDLTALEGEALYRAIFDERNGSSYVTDFAIQPKVGETVQTVALLEAAVHGTGWSKDDPDGRLDPGDLVTLKIGCNTSAGKVRFRVTNLRWVSR